jgi:hypothetical protein
MVTNSFGKIEKIHAANGKAQHALRNTPLFFIFSLWRVVRRGEAGERGIFSPCSHHVAMGFPSSSQRVPVFPILVLTKF